MNPLSLLGLLGKVPLLAWALAAALAWGGWKGWQHQRVRAQFDSAKAEAATDRADAVAKTAAENNRRLLAVQESSDAAHLQAQRDRVARAAAERAHTGLLERIAALQAGSRPSDPTAAGQCQAATAAVDVLADVLRRADARAGELAAVADAAITAGQACENAYDSLTPKGPKP